MTFELTISDYVSIGSIVIAVIAIIYSIKQYYYNNKPIPILSIDSEIIKKGEKSLLSVAFEVNNGGKRDLEINFSVALIEFFKDIDDIDDLFDTKDIASLEPLQDIISRSFSNEYITSLPEMMDEMKNDENQLSEEEKIINNDILWIKDNSKLWSIEYLDEFLEQNGFFVHSEEHFKTHRLLQLPIHGFTRITFIVIQSKLSLLYKIEKFAYIE